MRQLSLLLLAALLAATGLRAEDAKTPDAKTPDAKSADASAPDSEFDKEKYAETARDVLLAAPEEFKGKRITLKTKFMGLNTTFPPYMEGSGAKQSKYFWLKAGLRELPLLLPKDKGATELVGSLKEGSWIAVYGKVKKFKRKPKNPGMPQYYLEADLLEPAPAAKADGERKGKESEGELDKDIQSLRDQLTTKPGGRERKNSDSPFTSDTGDGDKGNDAKGDDKGGAKKELWFE